MKRFQVIFYKVIQFSSVLHLVSSAFDEKLISQNYRQSEGAPISLQGYKLNGFRFQELLSASFIGCGHACLAKTPKCISYNYYTQSEGVGRCELNSNGIDSISDGIAYSLHKSPNTIYVQTRVRSMKYAESCADHYKSAIRENGLYYIRDTNDHLYPVFCDFNTEPNKAWTLFMSESFPNRIMPAFQTKSLYVNHPVDEDRPNWEAYRLSLSRLKDLQSRSSHWRVTCNVPRDGLSLTDYVRGKVSDFDILMFNGRGACKPVEYINVMGHQCTDCTSAWWQFDGQIFHHDITSRACDLGANPGGSSSQDVFGFYSVVNSNFRCSSSEDSNTNYWFGMDV